MLEGELTGWFKAIFDWAEKFGGLSAAAVWALMCGYMAWGKNKLEDRIAKEAEKRYELRATEAEANHLLARALEKLADSVERIDIVLTERLPGKGG